jgi:diguanylate cyclase (GGDEF)-like protein
MTTPAAVELTQPHPDGTSSTEDSILLVDDDPISIQLMARILSGVGNLRFATSGQEALQLARDSKPHLILLDAEMPDMSGFKVFEALKADLQLADVPVIFVTSHSDVAFEVSALEMGAADFISKPIGAARVLARVKMRLRMKRMADELRRAVTTDSLTGVANRRQFEDTLEREWRRARRAGEALSLLLVDVDHFKLYNDRYGHPEGDACLQRVAKALQSASRRPADLVARYGGEQFMVLLPNTPEPGAEHLTRRILNTVDALDIRHQASPTAGTVTVSIGIGCYDETSASWANRPEDHRNGSGRQPAIAASDLVLAADSALYSAKCGGRARAAFRDIADVASSHPEPVIPPLSPEPRAKQSLDRLRT